MGGYSSEVAISMKSGSVAFKHLNKEKFNPYQVHILPNKWVVIDDDREYEIEKKDFSFFKGDKKITFDCVFNAIHGSPGEDGKLLAYFELINMKHTSAPFYQMALTFNKRDTLSVVKHYGIPTAESVYLNKGADYSTSEIIEKVGLPCFVKPNNAGSSFGISKVYEEKHMIKAIDKAFKEDSEILIESFLDGIEVSVSVIEYKGQVTVLPITEIVSENDFFDYDAKYNGKSKEITPARLTKLQETRVREMAKKVYTLLNMAGFSRSEYILVKDIPHFLEMNTVPGLTEASILPKQAQEYGIQLSELFNNSVQQSLNK